MSNPLPETSWPETPLPETPLSETQWLDEVDASMRHAGLPQEYTARTRGELADHIAESGAAPDQPPRELAAELVQSFRRGGWLRWLPPAVWLLLPLLFAVFLPVLYLILCEGFIIALFEPIDENALLTESILMTGYVLLSVGKVVAPALGMLLLCGLVRRMGRPWYWGAALFLLFALATAATQTDVYVSTWEESEFTLELGTGPLIAGDQLPQAILIALVGAGITLRQRKEQLVLSR